MGKLTRVTHQPGDKLLGGKGFLIPFKIDKTKPQEQVKPEQPTPQLPGIV